MAERKATPLYLALIDQMHDRIVHLGWTMERCDERSGNQDGYTAKMLHPDTPSGRQANWQTLQNLLDALYPDGVEVLIAPRSPRRRRRKHRRDQLPLDQCPPHPASVRRKKRKVFSLPSERLAA